MPRASSVGYLLCKLIALLCVSSGSEFDYNTDMMSGAQSTLMPNITNSESSFSFFLISLGVVTT